MATVEERRTVGPEGSGSGLRVRDRVLTEPKLFVNGTHRTRTPDATLRAITPHFPRVGITRLANITHLDRIGIPVTLSIRPMGLFLGVDSGKGMDLTAAKVSAAMEGIERWRGETGDFTSFRCTYEDARRECSVVPLERMQLTRWGVLANRWAYRWTRGWDLLNQEEVAVPALRVELPSKGRILGDLATVMWDSSGLASGNTFLEALHSALLELIERDAITCVRSAMQASQWRPPLLRLASVDDERALSLLDSYARARVDVVVADCTIDTRVATYWAVIRDRAEPGIGVFGGYGTHADPGVALCRALNEAAQGRLVFISGSRDDIFKRDM
ncbi:MAG: YcaO-like family protein, partial [Chloroflexi bacterium]|nr:YcaO-like family protein [Chloroflexota bacterium]